MCGEEPSQSMDICPFHLKAHGGVENSCGKNSWLILCFFITVGSGPVELLAVFEDFSVATNSVSHSNH